MFKPIHSGLIITDGHVERARKAKPNEPAKSAWDNLLEFTPENTLEQAQRLGLRYRFNADRDAGDRSLVLLEKALTEAADETGIYEGLSRLLVAIQCLEMLRDHPALVDAAYARVMDQIQARYAQYSVLELGPEDLVERLWLVAAQVALAISLEDADLFEQSAAVYRAVIDDELHPEGYMSNAVERPEVESLTAQIRAVQALVWIAEMSAVNGVDLWKYENRNVSALTAVTYPLYYYFYPEKWPWNGEQWKPSEGVELETAQSIFREHAGFLEIAARRYDPPLKAVKMILDDLRPVYDMRSGGALTLAFGAQIRRRGIFG